MKYIKKLLRITNQNQIDNFYSQLSFEQING